MGAKLISLYLLQTPKSAGDLTMSRLMRGSCIAWLKINISSKFIVTIKRKSSHSDVDFSRE